PRGGTVNDRFWCSAAGLVLRRSSLRHKWGTWSRKTSRAFFTHFGLRESWLSPPARRTSRPRSARLWTRFGAPNRSLLRLAGDGRRNESKSFPRDPRGPQFLP